MIFDMFLDAVMGVIVEIIITPIVCIIVTPYILVKAFFGPGDYFEKVTGLYRRIALGWVESVSQR